MKFVVFSDLHLHEWTYGSTLIHGRNSRLEQQKEVVKAIVRHCKERDIHLAFFCGDLFHSHTVTAQVLQAAYEAFSGFKEAGIELHVLVGNHDQSDRRGDVQALDWLQPLGRVWNIGRCTPEAVRCGLHRGNAEAINAHLFPFTEDREQLAGWLANCRGGFVFLHQGVGGVEINSKGFTLNEILTTDMIHDDVAMAFAGHYHSFKQASHNLIVPGSTMQLNWGDQGEPRGWLEVTTDQGQVTGIEFFHSPASRFVTVNEANLELADDIVGNFVRVVSRGDYSPEELSRAIMGAGAASCEIKVVRGENKPVTVRPSMTSFNEVVYSFAAAKEDLGVIDAYDRAVGDRLISDHYHLPEV